MCPRQIVQLGKISNSKIEVNLFYSNEKRKQNIVKILKKNGAKQIYGINYRSAKKLSGLDSARRIVDKDGIYSADVVLVPLEDGDRTIALKKAKKKVITIDLNPLSRTAQTANVTIVDDVLRSITLLIKTVKSLSKKNHTHLQKIIKEFDNKKNLSTAVLEIRTNLVRRARHA